MLGYLRMKVDEAMEALLAIASTVFPEGPQAVINREENSRNLREAITNLLEEQHLSPDMKMNERNRPSERCKVWVPLLSIDID